MIIQMWEHCGDCHSEGCPECNHHGLVRVTRESTTGEILAVDTWYDPAATWVDQSTINVNGYAACSKGYLSTAIIGPYLNTETA